MSERCQWYAQDDRGSRCRRRAEWMCWVSEDDNDGAAGYYVLLLCHKHASGPNIVGACGAHRKEP